MSTLDIEIDRLEIALHGVSASMAEAALDGLENELERRLAGPMARPDRPLSIPAIRIDAADAGAVRDAVALRALLAERLVNDVLGRIDGHTDEVRE